MKRDGNGILAVDASANVDQPVPRNRAVMIAAGLAAVYFVAATASILMARIPDSIADIWLANAAAIAFVLRSHRSTWPYLTAAVAAGCLAANLVLGNPIGLSAGLTVANTFEVMLVASVAHLWIRFNRTVDIDVWSYLRLLACAALLAPATAGVIGAVSVQMVFGAPIYSTWLHWLEGSATGAIVVLPIGLLATKAGISTLFSPSRLALTVAASVAGAGAAVLAGILPGEPTLLIGLAIIAASLWLPPLSIAVAGAVAVTTVIVLEVLVHGDHVHLGSPAVLASLAVLAPLLVSLMVRELRDDRARFALAMNGSAAGMGLIDMDSRWLSMNSALCDFLGYTEEELKKLTWRDIVHPDDGPGVQENRRRLLNGEIDAVRVERRYIRKDGSTVWGHSVVSLMRDQQSNEPQCLIVQIVDVTDRRKAELALSESEKRLNFALESGGHGVWDFDVEAGTKYRSLAWNEMFGLKPGDLPEDTTSWQALAHPDDLDDVLADERALLEGRTSSLRREYRMRHADGEWVWVENRAKVMERDVAGKPTRVIGIYTDITDRRRTEQALVESEQRWSFALESARQGVWDLDLTTGRSYYSSVWKAMLGYEMGELDDRGDLWLDLVHPDDRESVRLADVKARKGTDEFEMEFRMRHKDGHWVWVLDRGRVVSRDEDGQPLRLVGTHTDITERKKSEERMRRLSQRVQLATKAGGVGLWEFNLKEDRLWWDERMRALYGMAPGGPVTYEDWATALHPEDRERAEKEVSDAIAGIRPYDTQFRVILPDGRERIIRSLADTLRGENGDAYLMAGTNWDVTETEELSSALGEEKERLRVTLESIGDGVICTDTEGRVTFMNRVAELETGWRTADALGEPLAGVLRLINDWSGTPIESPVAECLKTRRPAHAEDDGVLVSRNGDKQDVRTQAAPIISDEDDLLGAVLVFQDVTKARRMQRQLTYSATHDALTDLRNRASFERELQTALMEVRDGSGGPHAVCFIDLDRFKVVNDTAGHTAGDEMLRLISRQIRAGIRSTDLAARLGGDEFALLLRNCALEEAATLCRQLCETIGAAKLSHNGHEFQVGASIGVAEVRGEMSRSALLNAADSACYEAKAAGRNNVRVYLPGAETDKLARAS